MKRPGERSLGAVPLPVRLVLLAALCAQIAWSSLQPRAVASAEALGPPPPLAVLRVASLGEPVAMAQPMTLYLQAFDNQPGVSIPFRELDYTRVIQWLATILALDPRGHYPMLMAAQIYSQVPDPVRERLMLDFVHQQFLRDPDRRWRWLAHASVMAKHRLHDDVLALRYASDIARFAPAAPGWAHQMHIFILEGIGEVETAEILLGGLLESGQIRDPRELDFLAGRLKELKSAEKPTSTTKK